MAGFYLRHSLLVFVSFLSYAAAQDQNIECYGPESVVVAVIGTLIVTLGLLAGGLFLYRNYWKNREGKHLMLVTDAENPNDQYAFDNPCFREATPIKQNIQDEKQTSRLDKIKWLGWTPLNSSGKDQKSEKITSLDDSYMTDPRLKVVTLKSHDFTGLGFNICGNMRDGIFIKDVLHRGPAFESGCINSGDRIDSVCISFRNMVFEDALAILSYASPYDVQVQVENDSYSRPSTLIRSKRESSAVSSAELILHPKYNRSQSISHLNEIGKGNNKSMSHLGYTNEKNRINQSLNKSNKSNNESNDYPTIKLSASGSDPKKERQKLEKNAVLKISPSLLDPRMSDGKTKGNTPEPTEETQNKFQKFGIKVLPIGNSKMGGSGGDGKKDQPRPPMVFENEINAKKEKPKLPSRSTSPSGDLSKAKSVGTDDIDNGKENVKTIFAKGFQNLKEKINQNTLGRKKNKEEGEANLDADSKKVNEKKTGGKELPEDNSAVLNDSDCPIPKQRSSATSKNQKTHEKTHLQESISLPEEVSRAGDVARNNRKSLNNPISGRKSITSLVSEPDAEEVKPAKKLENGSDSENSTDGDSLKTPDGTKKPKRSKGKAPAPPAAETSPKDGKPLVAPKPTFSSSEINEIKRVADLPKTDKSISQLNKGTNSLKDLGKDINEGPFMNYVSDSDSEPRRARDKLNNTKIELNATQVTVHQSSTGDGNEDDMEPSRKAASLGDLSKLDSEQPLSVVLERAVSLDLADGTSQAGKKRKAPLPPSEEFPTVFDDMNYRKEPRLENSLGLNTFQRRLKKSSDFGTLEDALYDGPKSLEIDVSKRNSPIDITETHNSNIQEFSTWLAECRKPKANRPELDEPLPTTTTTSLVNINSFRNPNNNLESKEKKLKSEVQNVNFSFSVNGKNISEFQSSDDEHEEEQSSNPPKTSSTTVVVISQPNSLDPVNVDAKIDTHEHMPNNLVNDKESIGMSQCSLVSEDRTAVEAFVTANDFLDNSKVNASDAKDLPPQLPTSPMPVQAPKTLSSPLTSSLTYITEIKVSTSQRKDGKESKPDGIDNQNSMDGENRSDLKMSTPKPSVSEKIHHFDSGPYISPIKPKPNFTVEESSNGYHSPRRENQISPEPPKIPLKTMKSETGQKVLATIQSLAAKEPSTTKIPEVEYAKRVASLFSGNSLERNHRKQANNAFDSNNGHSNVSGFYLKGPEVEPVKVEKDLYTARKVPVIVPPRKPETTLTSKSSTVTLELEGNRPETTFAEKTTPGDAHERNIVTFSSFAPKNRKDEPLNSTFISFKIKDQEELNGNHGSDSPVSVKTSATKIIFETADSKNNFS